MVKLMKHPSWCKQPVHLENSGHVDLVSHSSQAQSSSWVVLNHGGRRTDRTKERSLKSFDVVMLLCRSFMLFLGLWQELELSRSFTVAGHGLRDVRAENGSCADTVVSDSYRISPVSFAHTTTLPVRSISKHKEAPSIRLLLCSALSCACSRDRIIKSHGADYIVW